MMNKVQLDFYVIGESKNIDRFVDVFSHLKAKKIGHKRAVIRFNGVRLFNEYTLKLLKYVNELKLKYETRLSFLVSEENLNTTEFFFGVDGKEITIRNEKDDIKIVRFKKCIKIEKKPNGVLVVYIISADLDKGFVKKVIAEVVNGRVNKYLDDKEKVIDKCLDMVGDR